MPTRPSTRPTIQTDKQFWQQAEVLIGMLDAYALFGDGEGLAGLSQGVRFRI